MILDTNAISEFADEVQEVITIVGGAEEVAIPVVVLGEFRYGIAHSSKERAYEEWLEHLLPGCRILNINSRTASWYAGIRSELRRVGKSIPANDAWIAALSREHNLPVLSKDGHFDRVKGLRRISW